MSQGEIIEKSADLVPGIVQAEIMSQMKCAREFPRVISVCIERCTSLACITPEMAAACFYSMPRGGKRIEGPSIRLAEILAINWGNLRVSGRIVSINERNVVAQGIAHDVETNVAWMQENSRRIVKRDGTRFDDDMINVTCNAATSIASRNVVLRLVPKPFVDTIYQRCRKAACGDDATVKQRIDKMVAVFDTLGVEVDLLLMYVGKRKLIDLDVTDVETLIGLHTAFKEGVMTPEKMRSELMDPPKESPRSLDDLVNADKE